MAEGDLQMCGREARFLFLKIVHEDYWVWMKTSRGIIARGDPGVEQMIRRRTFRGNGERVRIRLTSHSHATAPQIESPMQLVIESICCHVLKFRSSSSELSPPDCKHSKHRW